MGSRRINCLPSHQIAHYHPIKLHTSVYLRRVRHHSALIISSLAITYSSNTLHENITKTDTV